MNNIHKLSDLYLAAFEELDKFGTCYDAHQEKSKLKLEMIKFLLSVLDSKGQECLLLLLSLNDEISKFKILDGMRQGYQIGVLEIYLSNAQKKNESCLEMSVLLAVIEMIRSDIEFRNEEKVQEAFDWFETIISKFEPNLGSLN